MLLPENANRMGALPGTIRSATVMLNIVALPGRARGLATVSLAGDVQFNEVEAPAHFSLLGLHVARDVQISVELCDASDAIESWPRWTAKREFTVRVENLTSDAIENKSIELLLWGYPPAPTPRVENWTRTPALALDASEDVVSAQSKAGMPLTTQWIQLASTSSGGGGGATAWADITGKPDATTTAKGIIWFAADGSATAGRAVLATDSRLSDARTPTAHGHATGDITGLDAAIATGASAVLAQSVGAAPATLDQIFEIAAAIEADQSAIGGLNTAIANKSSNMFDGLTSEVAVTGSQSLTISRMHVCSGTSANYVVTLPSAASNAGKLIGVRMASGLTNLVTIQCAGSQLIDGQDARVMWAQESAILLSDGTGWTKIAGRTRAMSARMQISAAQTIANNSIQKVNIDTIIANSLSMCNTTNNTISILRNSDYQVSGSAQYATMTVNVPRVLALAARGSDGKSIAQSESSFLANGIPSASFSEIFYLVASNSIFLRTYQNSSVSQNTLFSTSFPISRLSIIEIPAW